MAGSSRPRLLLAGPVTDELAEAPSAKRGDPARQRYLPPWRNVVGAVLEAGIPAQVRAGIFRNAGALRDRTVEESSVDCGTRGVASARRARARASTASDSERKGERCESHDGKRSRGCAAWGLGS
jgi:hypothetical protein